jgi:hypothetical protein
MGIRSPFGMRLLQKWIVTMAAQLSEYTENHPTVHFKWMNYIIHELNLHKAVIKKKINIPTEK